MKPNTNLSRRKVLGTVGGLAAAGSGVAFFAGSAAASVSTSFTANNAGTVTTADGSIQKVLVDTSGSFSWSGLDSAAQDATVTLEAKKNGAHNNNYSALTSKSYAINGLSGEGDFELDTVDLTEHFGDDHFESDTDGEKKRTKIDLRISVIITSADDTTNGADASDTMAVNADNEASDANINGESDASASSYDQKFVSHENDAELLITHGNETYTFHLDVSEWKDSSASGFNDDADNWMFAANRNANTDGKADFQVARRPDGSVKYSGVTSSGWEKDGSTGWTDISNVSGISASATDDGTLTVEVDTNEKAFGSSYTVLGQASAGGEYPSTEISNTEGESFSEGFDAEDEYYLTVTAPSE